MKKKVDEKKIEKEIEETMEGCCSSKDWGSRCKTGGMYGLGFLGAAIYYISTATSFWNGVLGVLKAFVWPAFLVYEALKFFGG